VKDAKEIADLQGKQKTLSGMGRAVTPILVPLASGMALQDLVDPNASVTFDLDGSGLPRQWGWITPKAAWLVFDAEGQGKITSGLQMFGNVTFWIFWRNGYEALRSLDDNHDGVLRGAELRGIALWQDRNSPLHRSKSNGGQKFRGLWNRWASKRTKVRAWLGLGRAVTFA
jgi:hypothetical protein